MQVWLSYPNLSQLSQREIGNSNEHEKACSNMALLDLCAAQRCKMFLDLLNAPQKQLDT